MAFEELLLLDGGWLTEKPAYDVAAWYVAHTPLKDPLAIEANWMAIRAGNILLEAGRPADSRMTMARYSVLRDLYRANDFRMSMTEISRSLSVTMTNVTKLIEGLVGLGLAERIEDDLDKRKTWAHLTPEGAQVMEKLIPETAVQIERNWSGLTDQEKRLLIHLLAKVKLQIQWASGTEKLPRLEGIEQ